MNITDIRIRKIDSDGKMKAVLSVTLITNSLYTILRL